jgi:AcrR family transcriptional regulator
VVRRADARRNHTLLVLAAREVFAEQGSGAPLEAVARRAGVGNATMYRHFANRHDLVIAVYADQTAALCAAIPPIPDPHDALFGWLRRLVAYLGTKRDIALAVTDPDRPDSALFDRWHHTVLATLAVLLEPLRSELTATDLLQLAAAVAITDPARHDRLLDLMRTGITRTAAPPVRSAASSSARSARRTPGAAPAGPSAGRSG